MSAESRMPSLYIPHGGGPCFFMETPPPLPPDTWERMGTYLRNACRDIAPRAILVISAHWETSRPTINSAASHSLYFDYYGFPEHTYQLTYPAKGSAGLAARTDELLNAVGLAPQHDDTRGLDHGVFIPFMLMFPSASIPVVQLSLMAGLDPAGHLAMGRALAPLRDEGVMIVGSGMSYHNMQGFRGDVRADRDAEAFDRWLDEALTDPDGDRRDAKLAAWESAPSARACHPREEHLIPLHVVAGAAAGDVGRRVYHDHVLGKAVSAFQFG